MSGDDYEICAYLEKMWNCIYHIESSRYSYCEAVCLLLKCSMIFPKVFGRRRLYKESLLTVHLLWPVLGFPLLEFNVFEEIHLWIRVFRILMYYGPRPLRHDLDLQKLKNCRHKKLIAGLKEPSEAQHSLFFGRGENFVANCGPKMLMPVFLSFLMIAYLHPYVQSLGETCSPAQCSQSSSEPRSRTAKRHLMGMISY